MPDDQTLRDEAAARATERLTLFSDAVVAIAITLLALELPVPTGDKIGALWTSFRHDDGHYAAFLISFVVIAVGWSGHHDLFRWVTGTDPRVRLYNFIWLLAVVLNPFATKLLTSSGNPSLTTHAVRFGFYALLQVLESAALFAMVRHLVAHGQAPGAPRRTINGMTWQAIGVILAFGLSIPVFFAVTWGWVVWFLSPVLTRQLHRRFAGDAPHAS